MICYKYEGKKEQVLPPLKNIFLFIKENKRGELRIHENQKWSNCFTNTFLTSGAPDMTTASPGWLQSRFIKITYAFYRNDIFEVKLDTHFRLDEGRSTVVHVPKTIFTCTVLAYPKQKCMAFLLSLLQLPFLN